MKPTIKHLEGKKCFVCPVVMLVEGVHAGSNGPLLYEGKDLESTAVLWNAKPVLIYHPDLYTTPIAGNVTVFEKQRIGWLFNAEYSNGKLTAEAWLEENRLDAVNANIKNAVINGTPLEVSTGLFTYDEEKSGVWNGESYVAIARAYRPDHLAILPDQVGACALADGCGLLVNTGFTQPALLRLPQCV